MSQRRNRNQPQLSPALELRRQVKEKVTSGVLLTTGEHEYTRYGFRQLLEQKCADILQPGELSLLARISSAQHSSWLALAGIGRYYVVWRHYGSASHHRARFGLRRANHSARLERLFLPSAVGISELPDR